MAWAVTTVVGFGSPETPDFYQDVYPFLKANCISCHNKTTTKAGLNMETPELMIKGGDSGPSIIPGNSEASLIVEASLHEADLEMPPKNNKTDAVNLSPGQIAILKRWIDQGAKSSVQEQRKVVWQPLAPGVHPIYTVAMTRDGRYAACGRSNQIFFYDLATRRYQSHISEPGKDDNGAHLGMVHALAFSPDGTRLASGGYREVKIWHRDATPRLQRKPDPSLKTSISTVTHDGERVIAIDDQGSLLVISAADGKVVRKIEGVAANPVRAVSVSSSSPVTAVLTEDGALALWDIEKGTIISKDLTGYGEESNRVPCEVFTWCSGGKLIAGAGKDKMIRVWDAAKPESPPAELKGSAGNITQLAAGADQLLASWATDNKLRLWNLSQEKMTREIPAPGCTGIAVSSGETTVCAGGTDGKMKVWEVASGKLLNTLSGRAPIQRAISDLEWSIARETLEQSFLKAEVARIEKQNKALDVLLQKAKDAVTSMTKKLPETEKAIQPARDAVTAAVKAVEEAEAKLAALEEGNSDAALKKALRTAQDKLITEQTKETSAVAAHEGAKSNISDAQTEEKRITASLEENAKALETVKAAAEEAKTRQTEANAKLAAEKKNLSPAGVKPVAVAFSGDNEQVAALFDDGSLRTWAMVSGTPLEEIPGTPSVSPTLLALTDGSFVATGEETSLHSTSPTPTWSLERVIGGQEKATPFADRVNAVCFSPDGKTIATGGGEPSRSGDVHLFDVATGKEIAAWNERHDDTVVSLDFSPNGKRLASGGTDKIARVTAIGTGEVVNLFEGHTHHVTGVSFRADGRVLATSGADGIVNSWDMTLGERKKKITGWRKEVTSLQFIGASDRIVTSAGDNLIRVVSDAGGQIRSIASLPDFMQSSASTDDGKTIIGGGEDSFLRVWDGTNGKEIVSFGTP